MPLCRAVSLCRCVAVVVALLRCCCVAVTVAMADAVADADSGLSNVSTSFLPSSSYLLDALFGLAGSGDWIGLVVP